MFFIPFFGYTQQSKGESNRPLNVPIGNIIKSNSTIIDNVPTYIWHRGCGPTALGMIIGYYDLHDFMIYTMIVPCYKQIILILYYK